MKSDFRKLLTIIPVMVCSALLTGCLATTNLAVRGNGLPDHLADIGAEMLQLATNRCIKITGYDHTSKDNWDKGRKLDVGGWQMRRFFTSNTTWVKAETITQGMIDELFFDTKSKAFICGSHGWSKFENTQQVIFVEYGVTKSLLPGINAEPKTGNVKNETRSIAIQWEGYPSLIAGQVSMNQNSGRSNFMIQLPLDHARCTGISETSSGTQGVWTLACSNQMSASGTFESLGQGNGSIGKGLDTQGKKVEFTLSGTSAL